MIYHFVDIVAKSVIIITGLLRNVGKGDDSGGKALATKA